SNMIWQIDTIKKTVTISDKLAALLANKKEPFKNEPIRYEFPGDISIQVQQIKEQLPDKKAGLQDLTRVSILNHKTGKEQLLADKMPGSFNFSPSPDGNFVNVSVGDALGMSNEPLLILVVSSKGELHSKITIDR